MRKVAKLFLERGCPDCAVVRANLAVELISLNTFTGSKGQELRGFVTLSNAASEEILQVFGLAGKHMPVLVTHEGKVVEKPSEIIAYLRENEMSVT